MASSASASGQNIQYKVSLDAKAFMKSVKEMKKSLSELQSAMKKLSDGTSSVASGFKKFSESAKGTSKSTTRANTTIGRMTKSLGRLWKMLRLMVTRMALRKLIDDIGTGFKGLAKYSDEFNASMSLLTNSSKQLSYSFSAMVSPLINALAPALEYIIQLCIKAVNAINQLFSAFRGASSFITAKKQTGDWAKSLDKASGSAKKLKNTLLSFDEINKLDDQNSGGGGASAIDPNSMFETRDIEQKYKDLAEKIKDIFNKLISPIQKAWDKMGKAVIQGWKSAFSNLTKLGRNVLDDFLSVWNQPQTTKIFENILAIIADIGFAISHLADNFNKAWEKGKVGKKIFEDIRDIIAIVVSHVKEMAVEFVNFTSRLDFTPLLEGFSGLLQSLEPVVDAITGIIEDLWKDAILPFAEWLIEVGVPKLEEVFRSFLDKVDWDSLREKLDRVWKALEPFAETVFTGFVEFIEQISDAIANFANSERFNSFIDSLVRWMEDVDSDDVVRTIKLVAGALITLKGSLFLISGVSSALTVLDGVTKFLMFFRDSKFVKALTDTSNALKGFSGALMSIGSVGTIFETFNFNKSQKELNNLFDDFRKGKKSAEEFQQGLDSINSANIVKEGYTFKQALADFFNPFSKTDAIGSLISSYHTVKKETSEMVESTTVEMEKYNTTVTNGYKVVSMKMGDHSKDIAKSMEDNKKTIKDGTTSMDTTLSKFKKAFNKENWTFSGVASGLKETFKSAVDGIKNIWNSWANTLNGKSFSIGGKTIGLSVPTFATGGFPEDGLFMANHGEMVGRFSNGKTAVANNEQITQGIAQAVYQAMMQANVGNNGGSYINNTIQIDGETIARAVTKGQNSLNRRYSPTMA